MPSIIEVANLAGVSKSTVSRVINKSPAVRPNIATMVEDVIRQIGYQRPPRRKRQGHKGIRTGNVALLSLRLEAMQLYRLPVFPVLLQFVETALAEHGLRLVVSSLRPDGELPPTLQGNVVDGILLLGRFEGQMTDSFKTGLSELPGIWLMREHSDPEHSFDHVLYDNAAVGPLAARYLLRRGHKHVAFLGGGSEHSAFAQRKHDFSSAIRAAGAQVHCFEPESPEDQSSSMAAIQTLVDQFVGTDPRPTGLFLASDAHIPAVYHALESHGLVVGKDVDVISCDNDARISNQVSRMPATIDLGLEQMAIRSVQQLMWRLRNPEQTHRFTTWVHPYVVPAEDA